MGRAMTNIAIIAGADDAQIADWLEARLRHYMSKTDGSVPVVLPGGSTPFPILQRLTAHDLEWFKLNVDPSDDRVVPEDHPASNTGKLRALLEPLDAIVWSLEEQEQAMNERGLGDNYRLVWLGMGTDGHIASLFPNTDPAVDDPLFVRRLTPDPLPPEAPFDRITLTLPTLLHADELLFVIRGEDKRAVFDAAARGENDLPIARLLRGARERAIPVTVFS